MINWFIEETTSKVLVEEMNQLKIKDAVNFILKHREGTPAFRGMSTEDIIQEINQSAEDGSCAYTYDDDGMTGIVTGELNEEFHKLFVHEMLCINSSAVFTLCGIFNKYYKDYDIEAIRDGTRSLAGRFTYNKTSRLIHLLRRRSLCNVNKQQVVKG